LLVSVLSDDTKFTFSPYLCIQNHVYIYMHFFYPTLILMLKIVLRSGSRQNLSNFFVFLCRQKPTYALRSMLGHFFSWKKCRKIKSTYIVLCRLLNFDGADSIKTGMSICSKRIKALMKKSKLTNTSMNFVNDVYLYSI